MESYGELFLSFMKDVVMTEYFITGKQFGTFCTFNVQQKFVNINDYDINIQYIFPDSNKFCVYDSTFIIDGKEIKPKIRPKKEAEEEYMQYVRGSISSMLAYSSGNGLSMFKLGVLPPNKEVSIILNIAFISNLTKNQMTTIFPISAKFQNREATSIDDFPITKFLFKLEIHSPNEIKEIKLGSNDLSVLNISDDKKFAIVESSTLPKESGSLVIDCFIEENSGHYGISSDGFSLISFIPKSLHSTVLSY